MNDELPEKDPWFLSWLLRKAGGLNFDIIWSGLSFEPVFPDSAGMLPKSFTMLAPENVEWCIDNGDENFASSEKADGFYRSIMLESFPSSISELLHRAGCSRETSIEQEALLNLSEDAIHRRNSSLTENLSVRIRVEVLCISGEIGEVTLCNTWFKIVRWLRRISNTPSAIVIRKPSSHLNMRPRMQPVCFSQKRFASFDYGTSWCGFAGKQHLSSFLTYDEADLDIVKTFFKIVS